MNKEIIEEIAKKIVEKIDKLEFNTEISNSMLWKEQIEEYKIEFDDLFELNEKILEICESKDYKLNFDRYEDACVGMPWDVPFIKEKKDTI